MREPFYRLRRFFAELKRRSVYRVAVAYVVAAFVVLQLADLAAGAFGFPSWFEPMVWVVAGLGFPIALVLAWAFEVTPEGVKRTPDAGEPLEQAGELAEEPGPSTQTRQSLSRRAVGVLVGLGLVGAAVVGGWYLVGGGGQSSAVGDRSVAVLPFQTIGDTGSTPFTEGLHNELLTRLQHVSDLTVIARPSVMRYEDTGKPLSQVAEELNARWIVTAAVQSAGDPVQVQPRLIDPRTGTERWSDSYRGELSVDVFDLQREITRSIADALEVELANGERERLQRRPTEDLEAYRLYVRGRQQLAQAGFGEEEPIQEAVRVFRGAIERDSSFALAWSGLADAVAVTPRLHLVPDSILALDVDSEFAARRALELDSDLAEPRASMGHVHLRNMDAPAARRELQRALDLKPSYWEAHHWLGELYSRIGRIQPALDHLELAVELNPQHALARHFLYDAYNAAGQYEKSLQEARRQQRMGLAVEAAVGGEVRALIELGRLQEARRLAEERISELGTESWYGVYLVRVLANQGDTVRARERLNQLQAADAGPRNLATAYRNLGMTDEMLEAYQRIPKEAWSDPGTLGPLLEVGAENASIRDDPRYQQVIRSAYRAWKLNPDGSFPSESPPPTDG